MPARTVTVIPPTINPATRMPVVVQKRRVAGYARVSTASEEQNIWTFDSEGELLITIMSSLAQEESRSISENVTWGQRKRFADGKLSLGYKNFLGYEKGPDKDHPLVIIEEQAEIVRRIYRMFIEGKTPFTIAKILTAEGVPTPDGKTNWGAAVIESILTNEKYKGSALLQKSFTIDFCGYPFSSAKEKAGLKDR